ncbi:hypothetical protein [Lacinutrix sp. Hel_I_90]|uniref:hypothetical protein n=1 Tax=Lacinutrix sp. Hel_I_90 TaxID=1249999 RepID=UPI0005CB1518|nr:hypothetical protein [Lacinutrix sp. Hel_I_90]
MKFLKLFLIVLFASQSFSQQSITQKAETLVNSDYFHTFKIEKFFLHTNKTVYFSGEKIWFKAYIVEDDSNTAFIETTNVYVNLYNENFELVTSQLFYAEKGKTYGEIELPKDLKSSNYYLQLDTQWNNNFKRQAVFPIQIIDLKNANGVNLNSEIPLKKLDFSEPLSQSEAFHIKKIENSNNESVIFELNINSNAIANQNLDNTIAFAVVHREGSLRSIAPVKLKEETKSYKLSFSKDNIFNGLNTLTLFNENNVPLTQANFFYTPSPNALDIRITNTAVTDDSLTINLNAYGSFKKANLSISVLPEASIMYKNSSNIVSHFLLQPYLKENDISIAQRTTLGKNLDELSQLKAPDNVFKYQYLSGKPLPFKNESGLSLNGKIQTDEKDLENFKIMLSSNENSITDFTTINSENNFKFDKLLLMHPSKYSLSLLNKKGKTDKASFFIYNTYTNYSANTKLEITNEFKTLVKQNDSINKLKPNNDFVNATFPEYSEAEALDEVNIEVYKKKKELELKQKIRNNGILGLNASRVFKPEDSGFSNNYLIDYLQTLPSTTIVYTSDGTPILRNDRGPKSINGPSTIPVAIVFNGSNLQDLSFIQFILASEIEYVVLNINGAGYGSIYPYGVLHIVTKKETNISAKPFNNKDIQENETSFGFNIQKDKYEMPELNFTSQKAIDNFSTIDWIPNFEITPNTDNLLTINRRYHNGLKLIINGLTASGIPFYKEVHIELSDQ